MRAIVLEEPGRELLLRTVDVPQLGARDVLVRVTACGVCRTDLHLIDGELPNPKRPVIPGHEIVGEVVQVGAEVARLARGQRVGVPWLGWTCGTCHYCAEGQENLCESARFVGYTLDGGYAEFVAVDERYAFPLEVHLPDAVAAPLLCAGLIGYRSLRFAGDAERLGLYGFGAAAHIIAQVAVHQGRQVFAFTRPSDFVAQRFAERLGVAWAGSSEEAPPVPLDAAILYAPVGALVPRALRSVVAGGVVVCAGIHMSDIPSFPYALLWRERSIRSVANLTRRDAEEFLELARHVPLDISVTEYPLAEARRALEDLRYGRVSGAAVLVPSPSPSPV